MMDFLSKAFRGKSVKPTSTAGTGGTVIYDGYIQDNEKDQKLKGQQRYLTYSEILANVSIVAASTRYFLNLVAKPSWKVEAADDSSEAEQIAEVIEEMMGDMNTPWTRVVRRAAMYRFYGFSIQEWTAKRRADGKIGMKDVEARPQLTIERWDTDESGTVNGVVQRAPTTQREIFLPRSKIVYMVDDSLNDSPEGLGLFRHITSAARRLQRYEELEGYGFETDLRGIPIGKAPLTILADLVKSGKLTEAERTAIEKPLRDFIQSHIRGPRTGLLIDSVPYESQDEKGTPSSTPQWALDLLKAGNTSQESVARAITRLSMEIARVLGTEHLLLGADGKGSLALSRDKTNNFYMIVDSTLSEVVETYERDYLLPIFRLNGWNEALMPSFKTDALQFRDIEQVTGALRDMASAGAILGPNDPAINEVRDLLGLSEAPEEDLDNDASLLSDEPVEDDDTDDLEDDE